jgi:hypothetical protein
VNLIDVGTSIYSVWHWGNRNAYVPCVTGHASFPFADERLAQITLVAGENTAEEGQGYGHETY